MYMPADQASVNLLGHDSLEESPIGRIVSWSTTYGRYIMILTEIVVLIAFVSRFSLDRKLTDLNEAISQKQAIIEANLPFEQDIRTLQDQLVEIKSIMTDQEKPVMVIDIIKSILPSDVYLKELTITNTQVTMEAVAGTTTGFTVFVNNLKSVSQFSKVDMSDIKKNPVEGILFKVTATLAANKPAAASLQQEVPAGQGNQNL